MMYFKIIPMKLAFIILILSFQSLCYSQTYLNYTSTWKEFKSLGFGMFFETTDYSIKLSGDTIINNKVYYLPKAYGIYKDWNWVEDTLVVLKNVIYSLEPLREENGIFYKYNSYLKSDVIIHNFNLEIGDTATSNCPTKQIVEKIDTVYFGSMLRKRYFFKNNSIDYLIEGVGSKNGLYTGPCNGIGIEGGTILQCYSQDGNYLTVDINKPYNCSSLTGITQGTNEFNEFNIFPNPFVNAIKIKIINDSLKEIKLQIFSITGNLIMERSLTAQELIEEIDLNHIAKGAYIFVVTTVDSLKALKIIKI